MSLRSASTTLQRRCAAVAACAGCWATGSRACGTGVLLRLALLALAAATRLRCGAEAHDASRIHVRAEAWCLAVVQVYVGRCACARRSLPVSLSHDDRAFQAAAATQAGVLLCG